MFRMQTPHSVIERDIHAISDDFQWYISPHLWTSLAADSGATVAAGNGIGGILVLTTGATNNNEAAFATTNKPFTIAANKPLEFEALIQYSEAATNAANVAAGFSSVMNTANLLLDDGTGPATTMSGALIFKVDGGTVWKCLSSKSTTQTISTSNTTAGGAAQQRLGIRIDPINSTLAEVTFFVDGQQLLDSATLLPIKHTMTYTSAVAMQAGVYVKDGSGTGEVVNVDKIDAWQLR